MDNNETYNNYFNSQIINLVPSIEGHIKWSKQYFIKNLLKFLPKDKSCNILEIGCGFGNNILSLQSVGYNNCYGIDISQQQINYANKLGLTNVECIDAIKYLSILNNKYDCILIIDVLEHLSYDQLIILGRSVFNSLKRSGSLIIQVPNGLSIMNPIFHADLTHIRAFSAGSLRQYFIESGFTSKYIFIEPTLPINNLLGLIKNIIWKIIFKPIINFCFTISYKKINPAIFTPNIIAIVQKE